MKRIVFVLAGLCLAYFAQSQSCEGPLSVTIEGSSEGTTLDASGVETDSECNDASGALSGAIDLTVSGGTPNYTYNWTGPGGFTASTEDLSDLGAGTYDVTITDAQNCEMILSFEIEEPDPVDISGLTTDLDCHSLSGSPTGAIDVTATGGTPGYSYSWSGPNGFTSTDEDISDLAAGTYTVTVTDSNNCTNEATFDLTEPAAVEISAVETSLDCNSANGAADGEINITVNGGTSPYTFAWTTSTGGLGLVADAEDQTGLTAGTYTVVVTDANNCTSEATYTLSEPDPIDVLASVENLSCHENSGPADGEITLQVQGGTPTYTYAWTGPNGFTASTADISGLEAGTYSLTITDSNNCTFTADYDLTQPEEILVDGTITEPSCNVASGALTGAIDITASGGTGSYTYSWDDEASSSTEDLANLGSGSFTVVVTDQNGCTGTATFVLTEPEAVTCSLDSPTDGACGTNILCNGGTADITVSAEGGSGVYEYSIDGGSTWQSSNVFNMPAGTHTVTVRDENNCESTCDITLTEPEGLVAGTCVEDDECQVDAGEIQVQAEGGCAPYTVTWTATNGATLDQATQTIAADGGSVTFTGATGNETYTFTVVDANGCQIGG